MPVAATPRRDPVLAWNPGDDPGEIVVRWRFATDNAYVHWGDSMLRSLIPVNQQVRHRYDTLGAYKIRIRQQGGDQPVLAEAQVVIRAERPQVVIAEDPDNPYGLIARAPAELDSTGILPVYRVHWDYYGSAHYDEMWGLPNNVLRHEPPPGTYTVRVFDNGSKGWAETEHTIPARDLDFSLAATSRTVTLTVDKAADGKQLAVDWGDRGLLETVTGTTATHTYPSDVDTTYLVQLWYADASSFVTKPVAIQGGSS